MGWHELRFRATQELRKRSDLARYVLKLPHSLNRVTRNRVVSANFFFSPEELNERVHLLQSHMSREVELIAGEADNICQHRFHILGYEQVNYGPTIDWHLDPVNGKRASLKPWFKVPFLDFSQVGDHKIVWELNRHQHLVTLAKAWLLTHKQEYVKEALEQWYAWREANPYPMGINWSSSLEVAFRTLSWIWLQHLLRDCPAVPNRFHSDMSEALLISGRHIECYLSIYFSANTHLLGEGAALFFLGTLCPDAPCARRWQNQGWRILLNGCRTQVYPDGVYFEQSLYYHVYALDFLLHARLLAACNQIPVSSHLDSVLQQMLLVVQALCQTGPPTGFGDDDGGRLFNPLRNRPEHLIDPLALGALLFAGSDFRDSARLTEESIWLFGAQALQLPAEKTFKDRRITSTAFAHGGIYVMAAAKHRLEQMTLVAGPTLTSMGGHRHADSLTIMLTIDGQDWLVDSGTYSYVSRGRDVFRGTSAHNTMRVDGFDQAIPEGFFRWKSVPGAEAQLWITGETFTLLAASHASYARLSDPVTHRRFVFHLHGGFWLVRDCAEGRARHALEVSWHFPSEVDVTMHPSGLIAFRSDSSGGSRRYLHLLPVQDPAWTVEVQAGQISPVYGQTQTAPVVHCRSRTQLPAEHAMVIQSASPHHLGRLSFTRSASVHAYKYEEGARTHYMFFAVAGHNEWNNSGFASNARFLYCCMEETEVTHVVLCRGSFARLGTKPLVSHDREMERFEWTNIDGYSQVSSSDQILVSSSCQVVSNQSQ